MSLSADIPSEAIYLRNWALNYLQYTNKRTGFTPGLVTPKGRDTRLNHIKPFLAQGVFFASRNLNDFSWIKPHFSKLELVVTYRERYLWSKKYGLGMWYDGMESGADNNIALLPYKKGTVIGADLNSFLYREYKAMILIAKQLGKKSAEQRFRKKAQQLKANINRYLWCNNCSSYFNLDTTTDELIRRCTYSNIIPLWAGIATQEKGKRSIKRMVINPEKLWARWGIRTLAKADPGYNNRNIIKPHSNWQGPVWPIANYMYMHALLNYGFKKQALELSKKIITICLRDIKKTGGMHECYHADTGQALAAPNFVSWNLLVAQMEEQAKTNTNPFKI
ncbi:MAG: trehalase family glycosidase [Candidatus Kerfeldbacteria bacterium]